MAQDNVAFFILLVSAGIGLLVFIAGALIALTTQDNVAFFIALSAGIGLLVSIAGALIARKAKEQAKRIAALSSRGEAIDTIKAPQALDGFHKAKNVADRHLETRSERTSGDLQRDRDDWRDQAKRLALSAADIKPKERISQ
jgi:hypothetical protein